MTYPPVCDYEGSDYQDSFWNQGGREYEDRTEAIALKRLLPPSGELLLELGAGAGRNTPRYAGFERIVLLDYSRTQLEQAQERLARAAKEQESKAANGQGSKVERYIFVAADAYRLPFVDGLFDAATMIRTLHHMADAPKALAQVRDVLRPGGIFILEFANKLNLKAILRYLTGRQAWNPFSREPVEFAALNFDFHPAAVRGWLTDLGFRVERTLALSYFRIGFLKRLIPTGILVILDSVLQGTGAIFQLSPSVFVRARRGNAYDRSETKRATIKVAPAKVIEFFKCPECDYSPLTENTENLACPNCKRKWAVRDGIYDFRGPGGS
ncbi:MAG TPA: class I SAM-dependent methyltransferase [Anaerolineales bacterium]|jgi:ubiquinone/menaquinone biosynthesis C-methylase UbiE